VDSNDKTILLLSLPNPNNAQKQAIALELKL
jgi:hypothetical protein